MPERISMSRDTEKIMEDLRQHIKKDYIQAPERVKKKLTEIIAGANAIS